MEIILCKTPGYINGEYSFRTSDKRLIGESFDAVRQSEFYDQLDKFRAALRSAPMGLAQEKDIPLSFNSLKFILKQPGFLRK
jgi:hypothetical protein